MPNWKKVIVSGSDASLNSITTPAGTINNITASYALNGGVTQLLAGPNITLSPTNGLGQVTVSSTGGSGPFFNTATGSYGSFYDTTTQTNPVANIPRSMSFNTTDITNGVSISGSASPFNTYIKTENAGIYNIQFSAQVEKTDSGTDEIVIWLRKNGIDLTDSATKLTLSGNGTKVVAAWNWFALSAANDYYQIIWVSADTGMRLYAEPINSTPGIPSVILTVNRVDQFLSNTGSFSGSFTGTLTGTASYATQALTSSYALTASYTPSIAGTDNYIPRFNGSSALENSVMYDDGTNIGIGTTSPSAKLHVVGGGNIVTIGSAGSGQDNYIKFQGSSNAFDVGTTTAGYWGIADAGVAYRFVVTQAGNVGIGTTSPTSVLSGTERTLKIENSNLASIYLNATSGNQYALYSAAASNQFAIYDITNTATRFMINGSGNIGIGTTSPPSKLSVYPSNDDGIALNDGSSNIRGLFFINNSSGVYSTGLRTANYWLDLDASGAAQNAIRMFTGTGGIGTGTERMRIDSSGNVGIGTTSPSYKIDIAGSGRLTLAGYAGYEYHNTAGTWEVYIGTENNTGNARYNSRQGDHTWYYNSSATMKLTSAGNLGIGTTTPTSNLQVQSNNLSAPAFAVSKSFSGGGDGTAVMHAFGYDSGIANTGIQVGVKGTGGFSATDAYPFRVFNLGTASFDVKSNNGIKFNLYGSGTFTGTATQKLAVDSSGNVIEIPIGAGPVDGSGTANYITRWVDTDTITTSSIYESSGNIGIGTTSPTTPLEVVGASRFNHASGTGQTNISTFINTTNNAYASITAAGVSSVVPSWIDGSMIMEFVPYSTGNAILSAYSGDITFQTNARTEYMRVTSTGNVGIGTSSPAYKLSVVGKMALNDNGNSVFIGTNAGLSDDATDNRNIAIGTNASQNNISGSNNIAIGYNSLVANTSINNTAVGTNALQFSTTSVNNTAFGSFALNANTVGSSSIAVGAAALLSNTTGNHNTALGNSAIRSNVSGSQNVGVGGSVLFNNTNGSDNVALGWNAARYFGTGTSSLTDTSGSIFIGSLARANASGEVNQVVIGMNALGLGSNSVVLGNDNITKTVLKGNVGIGTTSPNRLLTVAGTTSGLIALNASSYRNTTIGSDSVGNFIVYDDTAGGYRMVIDSSGNLGIGTTTPTTKLDVNGSAYIVGTVLLPQNPVGTTYGNGVSATPPYGIYQSAGDSDAIRLYAESAGSNQVSMVFEVNDDIETAGSEWLWRNKQTYGGYAATTPMRLSGGGTLYTTAVSASTFYPSSAGGNYMQGDGSGLVIGGPSYFYSNGSGGSYFEGNVRIRGGLSNDNAAYMQINGGTSNYTYINGSLGVATSSPAYQLDVNGTARVTTLIETSALKYKTNIQPLDSQLSKVTQLEPVTFDWIDKPNPKTNIGLIADEVEKIYPEFVSKTEDGEIEGIEYSKLTTVLIQSIKELKEIVDKQQEQINVLLNK